MEIAYFGMLKIPVGCWGGAAVGVFDIHLGNGQVALDLRERSVTQDVLHPVRRGVKQVRLDGKILPKIDVPLLSDRQEHNVNILMG